MNINDLLIEFDEMGYCPTTLCENPNEQAIKWKNNLIIEIEKLNLKIAKLEDMIEQDKLVEKGEPKPMLTNRDWLNNLSNEQLVEFIYGELPYIARQYAQGYAGVIQWLNEEHKE